MSTAIKVVVRVRPPSKAEVLDAESRGHGFAGTLSISGGEEIHASLPKLNVLSPTFAKGSDTVFKCKFSKVVAPDQRQEDVFGIFEADVASVLDGANVTIFAYGQTGTGKTHTMVGQRGAGKFSKSRSAHAFARQENSHNWGMIPRSLQYLFAQAAVTTSAAVSPARNSASGSDDAFPKPAGSLKNPVVFLMSYMQIYNDKIYDLLSVDLGKRGSSKALQLRMNTHEGAIVDGLSKHELTTLEEALSLFDYGEARRSVRATQSNVASSRSHVILQLRVLSLDHGGGTGSFSSLLTLVDLAGSEKWSKSMSSSPQRSGARKSGKSAHLKEMNAINTSLSALGNCIRALAENSQGHIPYRDSTLTKLLRHAFNPPDAGRGCHTSIIATVSPSRRCFHETVNTLRFADRARQVMVKEGKPRGGKKGTSAKAVLRIAKDEIKRLRQELELTRKENHSLRQIVESGSRPATGAHLLAPLEVKTTKTNAHGTSTNSGTVADSDYDTAHPALKAASPQRRWAEPLQHPAPQLDKPYIGDRRQQDGRRKRPKRRQPKGGKPRRKSHSAVVLKRRTSPSKSFQSLQLQAHRRMPSTATTSHPTHSPAHVQSTTPAGRRRKLRPIVASPQHQHSPQFGVTGSSTASPTRGRIGLAASLRGKTRNASLNQGNKSIGSKSRKHQQKGVWGKKNLSAKSASVASVLSAYGDNLPSESPANGARAGEESDGTASSKDEAEEGIDELGQDDFMLALEQEIARVCQ